MAWSLEGEYMENCSCDVLCPCITSSMAGPADTERCLTFDNTGKNGHYRDFAWQG